MSLAVMVTMFPPLYEIGETMVANYTAWGQRRKSEIVQDEQMDTSAKEKECSLLDGRIEKFREKLIMFEELKALCVRKSETAEIKLRLQGTGIVGASGTGVLEDGKGQLTAPEPQLEADAHQEPEVVDEGKVGRDRKIATSVAGRFYDVKENVGNSVDAHAVISIPVGVMGLTESLKESATGEPVTLVLNDTGAELKPDKSKKGLKLMDRINARASSMKLMDRIKQRASKLAEEEPSTESRKDHMPRKSIEGMICRTSPIPTLYPRDDKNPPPPKANLQSPDKRDKQADDTNSNFRRFDGSGSYDKWQPESAIPVAGTSRYEPAYNYPLSTNAPLESSILESNRENKSVDAQVARFVQ